MIGIFLDGEVILALYYIFGAIGGELFIASKNESLTLFIALVEKEGNYLGFTGAFWVVLLNLFVFFFPKHLSTSKWLTNFFC